MIRSIGLLWILLHAYSIWTTEMSLHLAVMTKRCVKWRNAEDDDNEFGKGLIFVAQKKEAQTFAADKSLKKTT